MARSCMKGKKEPLLLLESPHFLVLIKKGVCGWWRQIRILRFSISRLVVVGVVVLTKPGCRRLIRHLLLDPKGGGGVSLWYQVGQNNAGHLDLTNHDLGAAACGAAAFLSLRCR